MFDNYYNPYGGQQSLIGWIIDNPLLATLIFLLACALFVGIVYFIMDMTRTLYVCYRAGFRVALPQHAHGIILGKKHFLRVYSPVNKEDHAAVFGGSGSGKSTAIGTASLRAWIGDGLGFLSRIFNEYLGDRGFYAIDISGDISANVPSWNCLTFEPLNSRTTPYDVFHAVDLLSDPMDIDEALIKIVRLILPGYNDDEGGHWFDNRGRDILEAVFLTFYRKGMEFTEICNEVVSAGYQDLFAEIDAFGYEEAVKRINQFQGAPEKHTAGAKGAADAAVALFSTPRLREVFRRPKDGEVCIHAETVEESNVFLKIPDNLLEEYAPLVELCTGQLLAYLSGRPPERCRRKLLILIDEFASFPKLDITPLLQKYRKRGCRVIIMLQYLSQLDKNYGFNIRKEIIDNCRINVICEITEPDSADYFSRKAGEHLVKTEVGSGENVSYRYDKQRYFPPEEFAKLTRHSIILCRGEHLKLRKAYFFKEKSYRDDDRYYPFPASETSGVSYDKFLGRDDRTEDDFLVKDEADYDDAL